MKLLKNTLPVRIGLAMIIGLIFGFLVSESSIWLNPDRPIRPPQRIELVIPAGTAQRVAAGVFTPSLPPMMSFVQGDVLVVKNDDITPHQLGPIWVPAGSTGTLDLQAPDQYSYTCSFQPSKVQGIDVSPALTWDVRLQGVLAIGLPSGVMLAVYSFAFYKKKSDS